MSKKKLRIFFLCRLFSMWHKRVMFLNLSSLKCEWLFNKQINKKSLTHYSWPFWKKYLRFLKVHEHLLFLKWCTFHLKKEMLFLIYIKLSMNKFLKILNLWSFLLMRYWKLSHWTLDIIDLGLFFSKNRSPKFLVA